jgi:hypothetical protein
LEDLIFNAMVLEEQKIKVVGSIVFVRGVSAVGFL